MSLTVLEALTTAGFENARILAGWSGLNRSVGAVTVAEVPDAAAWLRGGELVLTTCYFVRSSAADLCGWVDSLARGGAAAIALKPHRFLGEVPSSLEAIAEDAAFPIIALPLSATWPEIIRSLSDALRERREDRESASRQWILSAIRDGFGFPTLARAIATCSGCAVIIQDSQFTPVASAMPADCSDLASLRRVLDDRLDPATTARLAGLKMSHGGEQNQLSWSTEEGAPCTETILALTDYTGVHGYLSVISSAGSASEGMAQTVAFGRAAIALSYDRLAANVERDRALRQADLRWLLAGRDGVEQVETRLKPYVNQAHVVAVEVSGRSDPGRLQQLVQLMDGEISRLDTLGLCVEVGNRCAILLHACAPGGIRALLGQLFRSFNEKVKRLWPDARVHLGVGPQADTPEGCRASFLQALYSLDVALGGETEETIVFYDDIKVFPVLVKNNFALLRAYGSRLLQPLVHFDGEHNGQLIETLMVYFACDCNIPKTSGLLIVHPNTLRYRLKHVEKLTGLNLLRFKDQAILWIVLNIHQGEGHPLPTGVA